MSLGKTRTKILLLFFAICGGVVMWYLSTMDRRPASAEADTPNVESIRIKTEMVQSIEWVDRGQEVSLIIQGRDDEFCKKWSTATVILFAEGLAVSGEPPSANQSTPCVDKKFEMSWPKAQKQWTPKIQKKGDYFVGPSDFYVSAILIQGAMGEMRISNFEIESVLGKNLEIVTTP